MATNPDAATPTAAAESALEWVRDGMTLGLGTGRAASAFVNALGARVADGLQITGVSTSEATADLARRLEIPLVRLEDVETLDISFDGADEVDDQLDLIKGYGGAMVREKVVAALSNRLVILVGPEKLVSDLGQRGRLPIEILPFGFLVFVSGMLMIANAWGVIDAKLAVTSAAREAVRAFVESPDADTAVVAARQSANDTLTAYGRDGDRATIRTRESPPSPCMVPTLIVNMPITSGYQSMQATPSTTSTR